MPLEWLRVENCHALVLDDLDEFLGQENVFGVVIGEDRRPRRHWLPPSSAAKVIELDATETSLVVMPEGMKALERLRIVRCGKLDVDFWVCSLAVYRMLFLVFLRQLV